MAVCKVRRKRPYGTGVKQRHQRRQQPQRDKARRAYVNDKPHLEPDELLHPHRAGRRGRHREQPNRRGDDDGAADAAHHLVERGDDGKERTLVLVAHAAERGAGQDAEQHHGGQNIEGQGVKDVRRDVEINPVDRRGRRQVRDEGRAAPARRVGQRRGDHDRERRDPEQQQHHAAADGEPLAVLRRVRAKTGNHRAQHIGQHGDLQQLDVDVADDLQRPDVLTEEQPDGDAERKCGEDAAEQPIGRGGGGRGSGHHFV